MINGRILEIFSLNILYPILTIEFQQKLFLHVFLNIAQKKML